jgi:hypothetical protein
MLDECRPHTETLVELTYINGLVQCATSVYAVFTQTSQSLLGTSVPLPVLKSFTLPRPHLFVGRRRATCGETFF